MIINELNIKFKLNYQIIIKSIHYIVGVSSLLGSQTPKKII